jgi:hypothetical protein
VRLRPGRGSWDALFSTKSTEIVSEHSEARRILGTVTPVPSDSLRPSNIDLVLEEHRSRTIARSSCDPTGRVRRRTDGEEAEPDFLDASRMPSTNTGRTGDRNAKLLRLLRLGDALSQTVCPLSFTPPVRRSSSRTALCVTSPPYFLTRLAKDALEPVIRRRRGRPNLLANRRSVRHPLITLSVGAFALRKVSRTSLARSRLTSARLNPVCAATLE